MAADLSPEMEGLENSIKSKIKKVEDALKDGVHIPDPQELTNIRNLIKAFRREVTTELPKGSARTDATKRAKKYEQEATNLRGQIERRKIGISSSQKEGSEYVYDHRGAVEKMEGKNTSEIAQDTMKLQKNTEQSLLRTLQMGAASSELAADTEQRLKEQSGQLNDLVQDMDDYNESIEHMNKQLKQVWNWVPRQLRRKSRKNDRELRKQQTQRKNERAAGKQHVDLRNGAAVNAIQNAQRINTNMDGKDGDQLVAQFQENDKRTDVLLKAVGDQIDTLKVQAENINIEIASQDSQLETLNSQMDKAEDTGEKISNQFEKHGFGPKAKKKFGFF